MIGGVSVVDFFLKYCYFDILSIVQERNVAKHYGLRMDFCELIDYECNLAHLLLGDPAKTLKEMEELIPAAQERIIQTLYPDLTLKKNVHLRIDRVPAVNGVWKPQFGAIDADPRLIIISGRIIRSGQARIIEKIKGFECGKCKTRILRPADLSLYGAASKPDYCDAEIDGIKCMNVKFAHSASFSVDCNDYQEVRIQEDASLLEVGAMPRSLPVVLQHDLVDSCKAGDDVFISGYMIRRWEPVKVGTTVNMELCMVATNVSIRNAYLESFEDDMISQATLFWNNVDNFKGRNLIVKSFCSHMYGMFLVKLATLLVIVGGSENNEERREGHLLLVGDPGTSKSQFLMAASRLCARSVATAGSGSTNAGLTAAAVKDRGEWQLEAGALVLADGGLCCIDEFSSIKPADRTSIHEAMEQQTLSVAKAGMICKLSTKCSIIAACNSKGKFEDDLAISANVALASPLLSRFDLILVLSDRHDEQWDSRLSTAILEHACKNKRQFGDSEIWSFQRLKAYINHVRNNRSCQMTQQARQILSRYYQHQRIADVRDSSRTTIRLLESLIRLAHGHAKLVWREKVIIEDAIVAIILMETSLQAQSLLGSRPDLFAENLTKEEFENFASRILQRLNINIDSTDDGDDCV